MIEKIKHFTLDDAIKIEETDSQFKSLKKLHKNIKNDDLFLKLIIINSIVCYQLSGTGEKYWEEFSEYFSSKNIKNNAEIGGFFKLFLQKSTNNKRFFDTKSKRIDKILAILEDFNGRHYYENMSLLRDKMVKLMNQKKSAKTIVFAVKMFGYGARIAFNKVIHYPREIEIPIDSRLTNLYDKYSDKSLKIEDYYKNLSEETKIPELHLDAVIWVNYEKLMK